MNKGVISTITNDIHGTIILLQEQKLIRDYKWTSSTVKDGCTEISFSGKTDANNILYDTKIPFDYMIDELLRNQQYSILMYDKSIIQAEYIVRKSTIVKARLVFIKKGNAVITKEDVRYLDNHDEEWFENIEGIPIFLRFDYDLENASEMMHPAAHLTFSNCQSCRIPVKSVVSFSQFVQFILLHFYGQLNGDRIVKLDCDETITPDELKMLHINWS